MILKKLLVSTSQKIPIVFSHSTRTIGSSSARNNFISRYFRSVWNYTDRRMCPPWNHCVQIGDPILRQVAIEMPPESFPDAAKDLQPLLKHMEQVLNDYHLVGIAAPQIGVSVRIFLMQFREEERLFKSPEVYKTREMETLPLTTVINPVIKVLNYDKKVFPEGCASICGYTGNVARFSEILLSGFNENGTKFEKHLKGWNARIAQHEMDHLNGQVYTDIMDRKSFGCNVWDEVNKSNGQLYIPFYPKK